MRTILLIAALLLVSPAEAQRFINIVNAESGSSKTELEVLTRCAIRTMRRGVHRRYRIGTYREIEYTAPYGLSAREHADFFYYTVPQRPRAITVVVFPAQHYAYGWAQICARSPLVIIAYDRGNDSRRAFKLILAHEIGHTLGAWHDEPPREQILSYTHEPLTIMYPDWAAFLWRHDLGLARFRFSEKSLQEMKDCGRLSIPGVWIQ